MMHGNILVITSSSSYWPDLGKAFERKGFVPAIWFGDYRFDQFAREEFPSCEVLPIKDFHIGLPSKKYKNVPNAEFLTSIEFLRLKNQAMKLMDRQDEIREFGRLERDVYFYEMFFRLYDLIIQKDIKFLVAGEAPHSSGHLIAYRICEYLEIPTFHFVSNVYVPLLQINRSLVGTPIDLSVLVHIDNQMEHLVKELEHYRDGIPTPLYMKSQADFDRNFKLLSEVIKYWKHLIALNLKPILGIKFKLNNDYHIRRRFPHKANRKKWLFPFLKNRLLKELDSAYRERSQYFDFNSQEPFVYFPLPYEPERTSNPDGGDFYEFVDALTALRNFVPQEIKIVVKEHPSQISKKLQGFQARSPQIYGVLANLPNVQLVPLDVPSQQLIEQSLFVSCITGTAALEAALIGKKSLIFGSPWFFNLPGIYSFSEMATYDAFVRQRNGSLDQVLEALPEALRGKVFPGLATKSLSDYFETKLGSKYELLANNPRLVEIVTESITRNLES